MTQRRPFDDVRAALHDISQEIGDDGVRVDVSRQARTGIPEIVYAASKSPEAVLLSLRRLVSVNGRAIASRCSDELAVQIADELDSAFEVVRHGDARAVVVAQPGTAPPSHGGRIGIMTAGTSDGAIAAEAAVVARELGAEVFEVSDVGVAGLHRLVRPLERLIEEDVDVLIVAAGMDGALASVVAGLAPVPVIGLPTSVGYGHGGQGLAALLSMLQSCAPGLVVVNIDNGVGAGATAALIANRTAAYRR
ncbi:MAG: nickel pincer cofactor biosynthesis protein LarB [Thermomicrobiales bacterium]